MEFWRDLIVTRGPGLLARYVGFGLMALAGYLHLTVPTADGAVASNVIAVLLCGLILQAIDHVWHYKQVVAMVLVMLVFCAGCGVHKTPGVSKAEQASHEARKAAEANDDAQFDAQEAALKRQRYKVIQLELDHDIEDVNAKGKLDPNSWPPNKVATEISRLNTLAIQRRSEYDAVIASNRVIRQKNISTNRAAADKIDAALNPPKPTGPVDLTAQIANVGGAPKEPQATLLNP